jgi:hypothetical protein
MTQSTTQKPTVPLLGPFKLLRGLVDLVGIEPTTSSMPWKRAPSCATGPLEVRKGSSILAYLFMIVKPAFLTDLAPILLNRRKLVF